MWFLDSKSSLRFDSNLDFESKIHVLSRLVQYVLLLTEVIIAPGFIKKLNIKHYPVIVCLWLTTTQGKINFSWFRQDLWFFHGIHTLFHHKFFWWRSSQLDPGQLTVADDPHIISADNFGSKALLKNWPKANFLREPWNSAAEKINRNSARLQNSVENSP